MKTEKPQRKNVYWDTSCFICLLNEDEMDRRYICTDVVRHARLGKIKIWTSPITVTEVIRPRARFTPVPLPSWASQILEKFPDVERHIRELWDFFKRRTTPARKLSAEEVGAIERMFRAEWLGFVNLDDRVIKKAVEFARDSGLRTADAIHAASAWSKKCPLQHFDKDYESVAAEVTVESPTRISQQEEIAEFMKLPGVPHPEDFKKK